MKKMQFILFLLIICACFNSIMGANSLDPQLPTPDSENDYSKLWNIYDSLSNQGLTQSASDTADAIYNKAKINNNAQEMIKALLANLASLSKKEEEFYPEAIERIKTELQSSTFPVTQVFHILLAEHYFQYYIQNRWRFYNRSQITNKDPKDIRTWDLKTLLDKTLAEYLLALNKPDELKNFPVNSLGDVITNFDINKLRPTLYDVIAHHTLDYLMNQESDLTLPAFKFELNSSEYFKPANKFIKENFHYKDSLSPKFLAITLLQDILEFHINDKQPDALIDVDLIRLNFVNQHGVFENKDSLYLESLKDLRKQSADFPSSAEVAYYIAAYYQTIGNRFASGDSSSRWYYKEAIEVCNITIDKYPGTYGAQQCEALRVALLQKVIDITVESVVIPDTPSKALITYCNITDVAFRVIKIDQNDYEKLLHLTQIELLKKLTSIEPEVQWTVKLTDPKDYQIHSSEIQIPALTFGYYVFLASNDNQFPVEKSIINYSTFQCSRLSFISKTVPNKNGRKEFYILDRETGIPLPDVAAKIYSHEYSYLKREYHYKFIKTLNTDKNGYMVIPAASKDGHDRSLKVIFSNGDDKLSTAQNHYHTFHSPHKEEMDPKTFFFTDRIIYRPGQTIYFKGIILSTNGDSSEILAKKNTNVSLYDLHGQPLSTQSFTTNDYGTFSGSFTAPGNTLLGSISIGNESGNCRFSVEEYKRPKFELEIEKVKGVHRLNDTINIKGKAISFAGSSIDGATVKYRVIREAIFPLWRCWWTPAPNSPSMEIVHGETTTNEIGEFNFDFKAIPDPHISRNDNPNFTYKIMVDVTDVIGETRSGSSSVSVSYSTLNFSVPIPQYLNIDEKDTFEINVTNTNQTTENAKGVIRIYSLKAPKSAFRSRLWKKPDIQFLSIGQQKLNFPMDLFSNENEMNTWERSKEILQVKFDTEKNRNFSINDLRKWSQGAYVLEASTTDQFGDEINDIRYFTAYSTREHKLPYAEADLFIPIKETAEPGESARFLIGSGLNDVSVLYELEHKGSIVEQKRIFLDNNQKILEIPVQEKHRGNISVHLVFIKHNRSYKHNANIVVPWTNKKLDLEFMTFRDKMQPGEKEEWRIKINGPQKEIIAAEMIATLYDASLDIFAPNDFNFSIYPFRYPGHYWNTNEHLMQTQSGSIYDKQNRFPDYPSKLYPEFFWGKYAVAQIFHEQVNKSSFMVASASSKETADESGAPPPQQASRGLISPIMRGSKSIAFNKRYATITADAAPKEEPNLSAIKARSNLNETAFFYPDLLTNDKGEVTISFIIPEALTRWKMLGFAHTKDLKFGMTSNTLITQKELMVIPNLPRFLRENDKISFSAKITNMADRDLNGTAQLTLFDAVTMKPLDSLFTADNTQIEFNVKKGLSTPLSWDLQIPENLPGVCFRIVAKSGKFSDGEEQIIPIMTNRMLVTESMPLSINKKETKTYTFKNLISQNDSSKTLKNHKLTLEFTSNPIWYAIQALPYLIEYPYECSEQIFSRFYGNSIANHLVKSNPKVKRVFDLWKTSSPQAFLSNLEKNQELKSVILEETPWLMDGKNEAERKQRIALLFDLNRMSNELDQALNRLKKIQTNNGGWPWFDGGPDDQYITQHIITGLGRMRNMNVVNTEENSDVSNMINQAIQYIDNRLRERYEDLKNRKLLHNDNIFYTDIQYLYTRSYFREIPVSSRNKVAFVYFLNQAKKYWLKKERYMQGMIALALYRYEDKTIPKSIIASLKENALHGDEMGMYWKEHYEVGWCWWQAPIETQALLIEAFDEISDDTASVEEMKTWLLKSKQTENWQTTKATTDAIYALLSCGTNLLSKEPTLSILLGDVLINSKESNDTEAGTGYFKKSWFADSINPDMGNISITRSESGNTWGAVYWQYFEQLDKIPTNETTLKLTKTLFLQKLSDTGIKLESIDEGTVLKPGAKITIRIELRSDKDLEYVHLKDMRAAGFEPMNVFSGYKWQDGLGYYESTRDVSTSFFISYLRKGTYVFEYPLVVNQCGDFSNGITTVQCMYAPEFISHSEGIRVKVGK